MVHVHSGGAASTPRRHRGARSACIALHSAAAGLRPLASLRQLAAPGPLARVQALATFALIATAVACGGEPPAKAPEAPPPEAPTEHKPALKMNSELGTVDPAAVKRVFHGLEDKFTECQKQGIERVEVLAGNVKFFLRIGEDGAAKWAYLEESEIGDHATEKCLLDAVMGAKWPKPEGGGEAEAQYGMELPQQSTRPPTDWPSEKVAKALGKHGDAIDHCKEGSTGSFHATMYVGPGGKVLAASVVGGKDQGDKAECLSDVLEKMKGLPSPGSWPAKVSFSL